MMSMLSRPDVRHVWLVWHVHVQEAYLPQNWLLSSTIFLLLVGDAKLCSLRLAGLANGTEPVHPAAG